MYLKQYYWFYEKEISNDICDKIIKLGEDLQKEKALIGGLSLEKFKKNKLTKEEKKELNRIRNSNVAWMNHQWLYDLLCPYILNANKSAGWNFNVDWYEPLQYTRYTKGQFYDWHCDSFQNPYNYPNQPTFHGKIRKLSATIQLTDPKEYKGGELMFDFRNNSISSKNIQKNKKFLSKGTVIVFPSFVWHKVSPVTKGERKSLVVWSLGKPFI
jgi:PKHD-type hydroxylase